MAITIDPALVNSVYDTAKPDSLVQIEIDYVTAKVGECLESSYGASRGGLVAAYYVASVFAGSERDVLSEKGSFGDSVTYSDTGNMAESLLKQAAAMDTNNCLLPLTNPPFGMFTMGANS